MCRLFSCFIAGALAVLAFAPFEYAFIVYVSLAVLFHCWLTSSPKQAFFCAFLFGLGLYLIGVSWIYNSLSVYGGMPLWMGSIAVFLFASVVALPLAVVAFLTNYFFIKKRFRLLALPFVWVIAEWSKSWLLTGFPWLEIGYSQTPTWLFSFAPVGGVYLISFLVAVMSLCLLLCLFERQENKIRLLSFLTIALIVASSYFIQFIHWSDNSTQSVRVAAVQANIPIEEKWVAANQQSIIQRFAVETRQLNHQAPLDLVVWPETALPLYYQQTSLNFWNSIKPKNTHLLTGILDRNDNNEVYNAAALQCANKENQGESKIYRKQHLVPFGEYIPLRPLFQWVLDYLQLPMSDLFAGQDNIALQCDEKVNVSLSICYEDAFAGEWRRRIKDATILVNISEDAWFGDSIAPYQRVQMARMRAKEFSKPLIRSANTGPSVIINHQGEVIEQTAQFQIEAIAASIQPQLGYTWFHRFGNWIIYFAFAVLIALYFRVKTKLLNQEQKNNPQHPSQS